MKVCSIVLSLLVANASGFAVPSSVRSKVSLSAATLEAPAKESNSDAAVMKEAVVSEISAPESNADRIEPGRYDDLTKSLTLPFLQRPPALDGSHAGDFGFDPLGFTETQDLYYMQECEIRHARLAMLAVIGWPMSELLAPDWMLQNGMAPSVLNGFNPLSFIGTALFFGAVGFFEYKTSLRRNVDTEFGDLHREDMKDVWKYGVAGDYNFDPLNLYSSIGDDAKSRKGLREVEISHGRSAMLGITSFALWEYLTGHPIVENSMFFHPNALLPALTLGWFAWNQIYEVSDLAEFPIKVQYTNEGEMKLQRIKDSIADASNAGAPALEKATAFNDEYEVTSKIGGAFGKAQKAIKDSYIYW